MLKLNTKLILLLSLLTFSLIFHNCKKDDDGNGMNAPDLEKVSSLTVSDDGDAGNGSDLKVSFTVVSDESNVKEYRIFVVNSDQSADFNLARAQSIVSSNYFVAAKTGANISTNLTENSKTTSGELITNDAPYKIFVETVTANSTQNQSALSAPSSEITLVGSGIPGPLATVSNLTIDDIGNLGNGADLQVSFSKVSDESNVKEYQIFVVNSAESADFDLATAESVSTDNLFIVPQNGNDFSSVLLEDSKTTSGELITNDMPYKVFVMTVTNDASLNLNALSDSSEEFILSADEKVKVTYIANDGIMIEFEDKKVVIDGIINSTFLGGWVAPSDAALADVINGVPPFDDIDVIMITHNHGDHYSTSAVQTYLSNHLNTKLIVPDTMEPIFNAYADRMPDFVLDKFERVSLTVNGISIDVLEIEHFDQFGNDFHDDESYAYLITMNGKKFLHAGDIDYIDSQLDVFNLLADNVDVVFIPTFGDLVSAANRDALIDNVDPENIVCLHFLTSGMATTLNQISNIYPGADTFTIPFETREY